MQFGPIEIRRDPIESFANAAVSADDNIMGLGHNALAKSHVFICAVEQNAAIAIFIF